MILEVIHLTISDLFKKEAMTYIGKGATWEIRKTFSVKGWDSEKYNDRFVMRLKWKMVCERMFTGVIYLLIRIVTEYRHPIGTNSTL